MFDYFSLAEVGAALRDVVPVRAKYDARHDDVLHGKSNREAHPEAHDAEIELKTKQKG